MKYRVSITYFLKYSIDCHKKMFFRGKMSKGKTLVKSLILSYIISIAMIMILAFLMLQFKLGTMIMDIGVIVIYIFSTFIGGLFAGKKLRERRFLWGLLTGVLYFIVLVLLSALYHGPSNSGPVIYLTTGLMCLGGGMLGGMVS